MIDLDKIVIQI